LARFLEDVGYFYLPESDRVIKTVSYRNVKEAEREKKEIGGDG
jgi:hypothetical protein